MNAEQMELGMPVYDRTMKFIGTVARTWSPEGVANPPEPLSGGTFRLEVGNRILDDGVAYFQLHRLLAPDWFILFTDVANMLPHYVLLTLAEEEGRRSGWQVKPIVYPTPHRMPSAHTRETKASLAVPVSRYPGARTKEDEPAREGAIENDCQLQAALSSIGYWKASIAAGTQSWLAEEQVQHEIKAWHRRVEDYRRRQAREEVASQPTEPVRAA